MPLSYAGLQMKGTSVTVGVKRVFQCFFFFFFVTVSYPRVCNLVHKLYTERKQIVGQRDDLHAAEEEEIWNLSDM